MTRHSASIPLGPRPESIPLQVQRIQDDTGSHIEPPLDNDWPDLDRLRWHAGVLLADTGLEVCVTETSPGRFSLHGENWGNSDQPFSYAWTFINGISRGVELVRPELAPWKQIDQ